MIQRHWVTPLIAAATALGLAGPLAAQTATQEVVVLQVQSDAELPENPGSLDRLRVFIDTTVAAVAVDQDVTVAQMAVSPDSSCPSQAYVYGRERPKWLYQTGRLMQAMREGAAIRVSFTCIDGFQSINAIQFLTPPSGDVIADFPRPNETIVLTETTPSLRAAVITESAPLPTGASLAPSSEAERAERARQVPRP